MYNRKLNNTELVLLGIEDVGRKGETVNKQCLRRFSHWWINYTRQYLKRLTDAYISLQDYI